MNLAHLHLLLNHLPTIGFGVGLILYFIALAVGSDDLKKASLVMFFAMALLMMPVYMSGNAAEEIIRDSPGVSKPLVETHEDAAMIAFVFMQFTGLGAWIELWQFRRSKRPGRLNLMTVLILAIVTFGLMARAAAIGGEIRHPEIRAAEAVEAAASDAGGAVVTSWNESLGAWINLKPWVWPSMETLHFVGLGLLLGVVLIVNLRMLGLMKSVPFSALHALLPLGIFGFSINLFTGMMFFIATPAQYTQNVAFFGKVILMLAAAGNILYLTVFDEVWTLGPDDEAPLTAKIISVSGILLWLGVVFCGRMLPFIGNSF